MPRMKRTPKSSSKLTLSERFRVNNAATRARLDAIDREMDRAMDRGEEPILATQDPQYQKLRREYDDLEREYDQRNLKRFAANAVAIYGGDGGKTVTSVSAVAGIRGKKRKATPKPKPKRRVRF